MRLASRGRPLLSCALQNSIGHGFAGSYPAGGLLLKVLIAEDDRVTRRMLEVMLSEWGYEVSFACDGLGAWQKLEEQDAPRLALLDWVMPGMDGLEVCRQVRKGAERPYTYILLVTSKGDRQHLLEGLAAGADDYLAKPFDVNEL